MDIVSRKMTASSSFRQRIEGIAYMVTPPVDPDEDSRHTYPGTPRWVIAIAVAAIVAIVVIGIVLSTGLGGSHGPQRHGLPDHAGTSGFEDALAHHRAAPVGRS
jgi:hypothetical protein